MRSNTSLSALHDITLFVEVARRLSFSEAGRRLAVPVATVSRRISAMEKEVGVVLFVRSTRRVELTEAGRRHFERCAQLVEDARLAHDALRDFGKQPKGLLRISMPVDLGVHVVAPWLVDFARKYPDIAFDVDLSSHRLVGPLERVDLALQIGEPTEGALIARRIGALEMRLFASPAYLRVKGCPQQPSDLADHDCITRSGQPRTPTWELNRGDEKSTVRVGGRFAINNQGLLRTLVERGMGIGAMPPLLLRGSSAGARLEPVLPDWSMPRLALHAVMASRLQPARVRLLVDFLAERLLTE